MSTTSRFIDPKDAKKVVIRTLKEYGSLGYSRLLMSTELPESILKRSLDLLVKDNVVTREDNPDPQYRLTSKGYGSFWSFS
jgi:DNA-binding HxlR family transcriptional regulator